MAQALIGDLALERHVTQHEDRAEPSLVRALQWRGLHRDEPSLALSGTKVASSGSHVGHHRVGQQRPKARSVKSLWICMLGGKIDQLADGLVNGLILADAEQRTGGRVHE